MAEKGYSAFNRELQINLLVLAISDCKKSCKNAFAVLRQRLYKRGLVNLMCTLRRAYRVVQLNFTPEIEVVFMLFDRSLPIFSMTSLNQHMEYFNFRY